MITLLVLAIMAILINYMYRMNIVLLKIISESEDEIIYKSDDSDIEYPYCTTEGDTI